jgi:hypothetical protein
MQSGPGSSRLNAHPKGSWSQVQEKGKDMATAFLKANIRLDKIRQRNLKPHYNHLTPEQYRLVKSLELVRQFEKDIGKMDGGINKDWRKTEDGGLFLERYLKAHNRYMKLSSKQDLTEAQENELLNSCHNSRFYGGSY